MVFISLQNYITCVFALLTHIGTISCTNITVIYDQIFHKQLTNNNFPRKENHTRINFLEIDERYDNLQNVTTSLKNIIRKDDIVILFTKEDDFIERTLDDEQMVLKYGISLANMVSETSYVFSRKSVS